VRRDWTGAELASRLAVTTRTIRNDVDRLRRLGYPVEASPGVTGGYRLGESATMPPMLLDDDEAVAVAIALRSAAAASTEGLGEASIRALLKIQRILPARLRERLESFRVAAIAVPGAGPSVDPDALVTIAAASRNTERIRFDYEAHSGSITRRDVQPYRLVAVESRWYLFAWDLDRDAWRTFRVDRMNLRTPVGPRFAPKPLPPDDVIAQHVSVGIGRATWRYRARVIVHAPADHVHQRIPVPLTITAHGPRSCEIVVGSDDPRMLALHLGMLDADFDVTDAPELVTALHDLAARFERAAGANSP
jgi:predicted DNA-binding transcriptional regulator YafY